METKTIKIRVNAEAARIFEIVSEEQQRSEVTRHNKTLEEVMSKISHKAQERGLTPKILNLLWNEQ
ncbi:MAG TPA: hypothetical protein V6D15_18220 [Oculatellaceae cyanobacterium]|jgi:hypothetical protein